MISIFGERQVRPTTTAASLRQTSAYDALIYTVFQRPRETENQGMVVALTSVNPGEGVSFIANGLVNELMAAEVNSVARINGPALRRLGASTVEMLQQSLLRSGGGVCDLGPGETSLLMTEGGKRWDGSWQYRRDCISLLRQEFDYTIIDCTSLKKSSDVLSIAPFIDGVVLVIEANRTHREQVRHAERTIEAAQGKILGHVLNKRAYEIPGWLYRRL
jgi:hypothetical protein